MSRKRKLGNIENGDEKHEEENTFVPPKKRIHFEASKERPIETMNETQFQGQTLTSTSTSTSTSMQSNTFEVEWFGASDKGKKPHMEDRRIEMPVLSQNSRLSYFQHNQCSLFGILDGHGGYKVASYLQNHLPQIFFERFEKYVKNESSVNIHNHQGIPPLEGDTIINDNNNGNIRQEESHGKILDVQKCLHSTFKITDEKILSWISPMKREGATGTLIFRDNNTIWCGNVGDSKAVLARRDIENGKLKPLQLSKDHTVLQLSEVRRVEACGGHVANGRVNGILEVTRSFGDPEFKKYGVISVPQISKFQITNRDEFVVIACDGLWSVFSIADCIKFVNEKLNHKSQPDVREVVRQLLAEAILNKQAKDNVSAIIIRFKHGK